jgi:hypothetical protein
MSTATKCGSVFLLTVAGACPPASIAIATFFAILGIILIAYCIYANRHANDALGSEEVVEEPEQLAEEPEPPIEEQSPQEVGIRASDVAILEVLRARREDSDNPEFMDRLTALQKESSSLRVTSLEASGISPDELDLLLYLGIDVGVGNVAQAADCLSDFEMGRGYTRSLFVHGRPTEGTAREFRSGACLFVEAGEKLDARAAAYCRRNHIPVLYNSYNFLRLEPEAIVLYTSIADLATFSPPPTYLVVASYDIDYANVISMRKHCSVLLVPPNMAGIDAKQIFLLRPIGESSLCGRGKLTGCVVKKTQHLSPAKYRALLWKARRHEVCVLLQRATPSGISCTLPNFETVYRDHLRVSAAAPIPDASSDDRAAHVPPLILRPHSDTVSWLGQTLQMAEISVQDSGDTPICRGVFSAQAIDFAINNLQLIVEWEADPPVVGREIMRKREIEVLLSRQPPISDDELRAAVAGKMLEIHGIGQPIDVETVRKLHELGASIRFRRNRATFDC